MDSVHQSTQKGSAQSTQFYLRIAEIHDNIIILKNGGMRAVLATSSVNVNLKSEDEQKALTYSYQNFLNSLEFPIQILVRSRKLDVSGYLEKLKKVGEKHTNELLKNQVYEYAEYVRKLVEYADIMEKKFYVIVPYDPPRAVNHGVFQTFWDFIHPGDSASAFRQRKKEFGDLAKGLNERIASVKGGLESCGLQTSQLSTKKLIALFYDIYNPLTARNEKPDNLDELDLVTAEEKLVEVANR